MKPFLPRIAVIAAVSSLFFASFFRCGGTANAGAAPATPARSSSLSARTAEANNEPDGFDHCLTSVDCAMNGECEKKSGDDDDPQALGTCRCFGGWKGRTCEELDLLPASRPPGGGSLQLPNRTSTWGGSVVFVDGRYHMFASEITNGCGLDAWTTNSRIIRAVSDKPGGPYKKEQVILPEFAHDANAILSPTGEIVLFATARREGVVPVDCTTTTTITAKRGRRRSRTVPSAAAKNTTSPPKDTYTLWAPHPEGPWSNPVLVLNSTIWNEDYWEKNHRFAHCDANLNGIIDRDGRRFLGLWRRCETKDLLTIPHTLTAEDWRNAATYRPDTTPLFVLGGSGAEDPSNVWTTQTRDIGTAYHAIFHDEQSTRCVLGRCSANGRHAFSLDGRSWSYGKTDAYDRRITFAASSEGDSDDDVLIADTRARPHVVVGDNNQLLALSTGLKPRNDSDYVWTLVQPLRQQTKTDVNPS